VGMPVFFALWSSGCWGLGFLWGGWACGWKWASVDCWLAAGFRRCPAAYLFLNRQE